MSTKDAITAGIAAHGMWKQRLIDAINTGKSTWSPATVKLDNQCEFGKWLYSCSPQERGSAHYAKIKDRRGRGRGGAAGGRGGAGGGGGGAAGGAGGAGGGGRGRAS